MTTVVFLPACHQSSPGPGETPAQERAPCVRTRPASGPALRQDPPHGRPSSSAPRCPLSRLSPESQRVSLESPGLGVQTGAFECLAASSVPKATPGRGLFVPLSTLICGGPLCEPDCQTRGGSQRIFSFFHQKIKTQLEREDAGVTERARRRRRAARRRGRASVQQAPRGTAFAGRARPRGPRGRSEVPVAGPPAQWQTTSNGLIS